MGQILHGSATTTEAVRRAIQNSQASLRALSKRYGINQKTVAKWKKRSSVSDLPTGPTDAKSSVLSAEEEAIIVAFRRHTLLPLDDCLYALQPAIPHLTRSSLHRCAHRVRPMIAVELVRKLWKRGPACRTFVQTVVCEHYQPKFTGVKKALAVAMFGHRMRAARQMPRLFTQSRGQRPASLGGFLPATLPSPQRAEKFGPVARKGYHHQSIFVLSQRTPLSVWVCSNKNPPSTAAMARLSSFMFCASRKR